MSSPTGQQVRWDPKTRRHYALDGQTGRWVPVEPPNQPRTARPSGLLPGAQAGSLLRSPPSATNSGYTTASPDVTGAINQNQGLNIGNRAGASNQPMIAQGAPLQTKPLDPEYQVRKSPTKFFQFGKVFLTLWTEPEGQTRKGQSSFFSRNKDVYRVAFHETVYSKVRRFIVLRQGDRSCICLAISTHSGLGATQRSPFEHGIVYTGTQPPQPISQTEMQMQPIPIRIDVDQKGTALDSSSRVHYGKLYTIEHNLKVKPFGMVSPGSVQAFNSQAGTVWAKMSAQTPQPLPTIQQGQPLNHPVASPSGSNTNTQRLPPRDTLKANGFNDPQINTMQLIVDRGMSPKYAVANVRAQAMKASTTQAHEVGRLVIGGKDFQAAFAQVLNGTQEGTGGDIEEQGGGADDDDEDDDDSDDEDDDDSDDAGNDSG